MTHPNPSIATLAAQVKRAHAAAEAQVQGLLARMAEPTSWDAETLARALGARDAAARALSIVDTLAGIDEPAILRTAIATLVHAGLEGAGEGPAAAGKAQVNRDIARAALHAMVAV